MSLVRSRPRSGSSGGGKRPGKRFVPEANMVVDYKDPQTLRNFVTDRGKLMPMRIEYQHAKLQRRVAVAVKRARMLALMPFTVTGK